MIFLGAIALLGALFVAAAVIDIKAHRRRKRLRVEGVAHTDIYGNRHMRPIPPIDPTYLDGSPPPSSGPPSSSPAPGGSF
jgi:hypothetical protein